MHHRTVGRPRTWLMGALLVAGTIVLPSCKDDKGTGPSATVIVLVGSVNGSNGAFSGSIELSIDGGAASGTFHIVSPADATHALTGTYNAGTKGVAVSGGGYNFAGVYDGNNRLEGTVSGAGNGTFVAVKDASLTFCGEFTGDDDGVWNFTIDDGAIVGSATTTSGTVIALDGTISGNAITIARPGGGTLATGARNGDNASGTWDNGVGSSGTWTGAKCS